MTALTTLRRWTILGHRYLGIALAAVFVVWFLSGIGMVFTGGMPELTDADRVSRLPPLNLSQVVLDASEAARSASIEGVTLTSVVGRPAYRVDTGLVVFADTGEPARPSPSAIAAAFLGTDENTLRDDGALAAPDQWTLELRRRLPLHKIVADDAARTEVYVSEADAEVVLATTRRSRTLAWVSAIPHWFYFTPLRTHSVLWARLIIWIAAAGTVLAIAGLVLAVLQFRPRRPFLVSELTSHNPYAGWMRWHYVTGAMGGVFALTWVFSGLLSMQPGDWAAPAIDGQRIQTLLDSGAAPPQPFPLVTAGGLRQLTGDVREITFLRKGGAPYLELKEGNGRTRLVDAVALADRVAPFPTASLVSLVREGADAAPVKDTTQLDAYDSYYYSRRQAPPLPVLRIILGDSDRTWVYVDPMRADVVGVYSWRGRLERWAYHGLHSLDVSFLYASRGLWTIVVVALCALGTLLSVTGLFVGARRLLRNARGRG